MVQIPAFFISFNRGQILLRAIAGIRRMNAEVDVVVHDNGSDDTETLKLLDVLEHQDVRVVRRGKISTADELNNTNDTVADYFRDKLPAPYIVSDCDVDIGCADPRAPSIYLELLDRFPGAECVGPMLRIRDIPRNYPQYARVMNRHIEQFWGKRPSWCETTAGPTAYQFALIDATFAIHRAGNAFRRLKRGIRVYEPFEALHLDWYHSGVEDAYAISSNPAISHWNNRSAFLVHGTAEHKYSKFYVVEHDGKGGLIEREVEYR